MIDHPMRPIIAVVDDDRRVLESLGSLLESADYLVRPFESATALLESNCLPEIACLISDIDMPAIDGFQLLGIVQLERPELPVLLITGQSSKFNLHRSAESGHYQLLKKPFRAKDLLALISEALHDRVPRPPLT